MKNLKFFTALFIAVVSLSMVSCNDDDENTIPETIKLPVRLEYEGGKYLEYGYDEKVRLSKMEFRDSSQFIVADIIYDTEGRIVKTSINLSDEMTVSFGFTHIRNRIQVTSEYGNPHTIELDEKGRLLKISGKDRVNHELRYEYDAKDNVIGEAAYVDSVLISRNIYSYDEKIGYNKNVNVPLWAGYYLPLESLFPGKANNEIGESVYVVEADSIVPSTQAVYTYDNEGYPVTATFSYEGTVMNKLTVVYENKVLK
ncbi:MAG: hypothetical protein E6772_16595 [Dysgonomonas sp.]|nr:hypothetical protein [Dysgonomonas sp.]